MIVLALDTETTGLLDSHSLPLAKQPSIIEFYGCLVDLETGEVLDEIDELIKPPQPLSEEITRITHITDAMLADAPPFAVVAPRILAALEAAPAVLAHNLSYDQEMLDLEFERMGQTVAWPTTMICTVEATVHLKGFRLSLAALHELLFSESFPEAHRAKNDVQATVRCAAELLKRGEL